MLAAMCARLLPCPSISTSVHEYGKVHDSSPFEGSAAHAVYDRAIDRAAAWAGALGCR